MNSKYLKDLSLHSIGGGWGQESRDETHVEKVAVIRGTDMPRLSLGEIDTVPSRWEKTSKVSSRLLKPGDILIEVSGGSAATGQHTGRALLVTQNIIDLLGGVVIPASFCRLLRLDSSQVDPRYITYQIAGMHLSGEIAEFENQSTGIANFQFTRFISQVSPLIPNKEEQAEVSATLGALDDQISILRETNVTLEAIAQAIFKSWFVDFDPVKAKAAGLVPGGIDDATATLFPDSFDGPIPSGWSNQAIGEITAVVGGSTPDTKKLEYWEPAVINWTSPRDLSGLNSPVLLDTDRKISSAGLAKISSGLLPKGTLLLSSRAPIGYLAISQIPIAINQGYIAMPPGGKLPPLYLYFWCKQNMEEIKSRSNGSTFMEISKSAFRPIPAIVPPPKIIEAFMSVAGVLFEEIVAQQEEIKTLSELRDTLLPRLISGKLRIPETQEAVEEMA